ncbi:hypothetical protein EB796_020481 [Bugula neritina]|uniref:Uncharacterized protein n=1 Tax=Bugula neritina TaxID=10212 RepID=A0A7J7J6E0_BUGNE|nr:hypothetical protein EB796_020481 [Bugula neritina]
MMAVTNTIRNYFLLFLLYINSWIDYFKVKLGVLKVKYGLVGHFEKNGIIWSRNLHTERMVDAAVGFTEFKPDDVILAAYPKAGTNFTVGIIMSIYRRKV